MELNAETLEPDRALDVLDGALGGIAGPAELYLCARRERATLFETGTGGRQSGIGAELIATARVWRDERCGVAVGGARSLNDLLKLLWAAENNAPFGPSQALPSPAFARPAGPAPDGLTSNHLAPLEAVAAGLVSAPGRVQNLLWREDRGWVAVASSAGVRAAQWVPSQRLMVRHEHPRGALVDGLESAELRTEDVPPLLARLGQAFDALDGEGGAPEPGLPWLLSPQAAAPLVSGLGWLLAGDTAAAVPGIARALGKKIFPSCLTFGEGVSAPARHLDDEGQPCAEVMLVREGRLEQFAQASDSAARLKLSLNGCALRLGGSGAPVSRLRAPTVSPGHPQWPADRNELTARLETFVAGPRAGKVLCVLAGFVVRGGARIRRIAPFEAELPILDTFRGLLQVGDDAAHFPTVDGARTPSLLVPPPKA